MIQKNFCASFECQGLLVADISQCKQFKAGILRLIKGYRYQIIRPLQLLQPLVSSMFLTCDHMEKATY